MSIGKSKISEIQGVDQETRIGYYNPKYHHGV